uniref:SH2 domain-containing adapter protein D n=1 Tax=Salvator merianae TaxID=96440 RepID=A0A8D0BNT3_SALMN
MARWLRDRLLFRSAKPAPPQPDYRAGPPEQPDLLAAYRLQREQDFEDPYAGGDAPPAPAAAARRCRSPRRRLIRVETGASEAAADGSQRGGDSQGRREKVMILEDYADPYDTREDLGGQTEGQENVKSEGYMEPYEAQKLLAEIQKSGCQDGLVLQKSLHLYDIPYEGSESDTDSGHQRLPVIRCRYSWLPEDDERPPEEYDQPWEWKKERISRVFAVEIEGVKDLPWPPPVGQLDSSMGHSDAERSSPLQGVSVRCLIADLPASAKNSNGTTLDSTAPSSRLDVADKEVGKLPLLSFLERTSSPCWLSMEDGLAFGERVNPSLPLESQAWYHGTLSRVDAEGLLRLCREASYLVRNSESSHDAFSLSLKSSQGFLHMKLVPTEDHKFVLGQHSPPFDNVPEIIHHYANHKLPIKGAEHMSLLYPVLTQPSNCLAAEQ